jgi:coenzyme F420-reducing hydrogenase beta subunit
MIKITDPSKCCGCTACQAVCPKDAIIMKPDVLGFLYPQVDEDKCVDCGLCEKVCDFSSRYPQLSADSLRMNVYAVRHQDPEVVANSQSGGAFTVLSSSVLSEGGTVYGAVLNKDFTVSHVRACNEAERDKMRGSK